MTEEIITYKTDIYSFGCNFEVRINDIHLFSINNGNGVSLQLPIDSFIQNGENLITITIYSKKNRNFSEEPFKFKLEFFSQTYKSNQKKALILGKVEHESNELNSTKSIVSDFFPFKLDSFPQSTLLSNCHIIKEPNRYFEMLIKCYKELYSIFKNGSWDDYLSLIFAREQDLSKIKQYSLEDRLNQMKSEFLSDYPYIQDNSFLLLESSNFKVEYGGRLLSIGNSFHEPFIECYYPAENITTFHEHRFGIVEDKLIIVR